MEAEAAEMAAEAAEMTVETHASGFLEGHHEAAEAPEMATKTIETTINTAEYQTTATTIVLILQL